MPEYMVVDARGKDKGRYSGAEPAVGTTIQVVSGGSRGTPARRVPYIVDKVEGEVITAHPPKGFGRSPTPKRDPKKGPPLGGGREPGGKVGP